VDEASPTSPTNLEALEPRRTAPMTKLLSSARGDVGSFLFFAGMVLTTFLV